MPKPKWKITAQVVAYESKTVEAETPEEAIEIASDEFEEEGTETVGAFRYLRLSDEATPENG